MLGIRLLLLCEFGKLQRVSFSDLQVPRFVKPFSPGNNSDADREVPTAIAVDDDGS